MAKRPAPTVMLLPMRIWDSPIRLFHWTLAILVVLSWVSIEIMNNLTVHMLVGYAIIALLLWRIVWGFVGSDTARFGQFVRSPLAALCHLLHFARREPDTQVGHNEAGGWMVVVMLLILLLQVTTGLFAVDEESFVYGPLAKLIGDANGAISLRIHRFNVTLVEIVVAMHIVAIVLYAVVKKHDLVRPMFTGKKRLPAATPAPRMVSPVLAAAILAVCGGLVWVLVTKL